MRLVTLFAALALGLAPLAGCDDDDLGQIDADDNNAYADRGDASDATEGENVNTLDDTGNDIDAVGDTAARDAQDSQLARRDAQADGEGVYASPRTDGSAEGSAGKLAGPIALQWQGPDQLRAGESFTYRVQVTNRSQSPVHQVKLRSMVEQANGEQSQSQQRNAQSQQQGNAQSQQQNAAAQKQQPQKQQQQRQGQQAQSRQQGQQGQQGQSGRTWEVGMLMPGQSKVIEIQDALHQEGEAKVCLAVSYEPAVCKVINVVKPAIRLTRRIVDAEGQPVRQAYTCDEIFAVYTVTNTGTGDTDAVTVRDEFGEGITANNSQRFEAQSQPIAAGETAELRVQLDVQQSTSFTGRAGAYTDELEVQSNPADDIRFLKPELKMTIEGAHRQYPNRPVQYTVQLTNTSDDPAIDTQLMLKLPENAARPSVSAGAFDETAGVLEIGRLEGGESVDVIVLYELADPGESQFTAAAHAYCVDRIEKSVTTQIVGVPALRLETIDLTDPVPQGETTIYAIRIKNQGTKEDLNVQLTGELPQQLQFVEATGDSQVQVDGQKLTFGAVDRLGPGQLVEWRVKVRAQNTGRVRLKLNLKSDATKQGVIEQEPTTVY